MAEQASIDNVKELSPSDVGTWGYDDAKIGVLLDSGLTVNKVLARIWNAQAARTVNFVDVSESGSSRSISTIHSNAVRMAAYFDEKVAAEDRPTTEAAARGRVVSYTATRV